MGLQRLRKSQMVVIKGTRELLYEIALIVPDLSLFMVSRTDEEDNIIWLASYDVDLRYEGDMAPNSQRVQDTLSNLFSILPRIFSRKNVEEMQWGVYTGLKAEADSGSEPLPYEWIAESFGTRNLFAVWPTKLTLAPEASEKLVFKILDRFAPSRTKLDPGRYGLPPEKNWQFDEEKWRSIHFVNWDEFKNLYNIVHRGS